MNYERKQGLNELNSPSESRNGSIDHKEKEVGGIDAHGFERTRLDMRVYKSG